LQTSENIIFVHFSGSQNHFRMNIRLDNKTALVCGSTQGIGKATAIALAELGAGIVLLARNPVSLEETKSALPGDPVNHDILVADFSEPADLKTKLHQYLQKSGRQFNILVNNTGGPKGGPAHLAGTEEFEKAFAQHLVCNQILVQALLPGMKETAYGRVINVISTSVKQPLPGLGVSNTIRGAVANWAKTLANELGPFGITVNNVLPGATATARLWSLIEGKAEKTGKTVKEVEKQMMGSIPLGRFAEAAEVANAIAFLASPAAAYINGINLPVDGGRTASL
jgi:3-oxoacyl-[acyl-carrier protein] reductase